MVLDATDFQAITESALKQFDERVAGMNVELGGGFDMEVARLESQVVQLYGIAALLARREIELDKIAEIWGAMGSVCDAVALKIQQLCAGHPHCAASHDKVLDIRNKCTR